MGPSFIRSCAGDRCPTGNSPTQTRRLNLKWNYSLDGWLLRQAWQQRLKKYRQSSKWNINSPPRFYSLRTDSRLLWHPNRTLTHPDAEFLKTPTFTYCSPLRDARMINGGLGGQAVILTQRECIILTWLMIKECVLAAGPSSTNTTNHFIYELVLNHQTWSGQRDQCPHSPSHPHQSRAYRQWNLNSGSLVVFDTWTDHNHGALARAEARSEAEHTMQRAPPTEMTWTREEGTSTTPSKAPPAARTLRSRKWAPETWTRSF